MTFSSLTPPNIYLELQINTTRLSGRNLTEFRVGWAQTEHVIGPVSVTDGNATDIGPHPHKSVAKGWTVRYRFRINVLPLRHRPVVKELGHRGIVHFSGIVSTHHIADVGKCSSLNESVTREVVHESCDGGDREPSENPQRCTPLMHTSLWEQIL